MYCKQCGKEIDETALFCPNCGASQRSEAIPPAPQPEPAMPPVQPRKRSAKKVVLICMAVALALALCAAVLFLRPGRCPVVGKWEDLDTPGVFMILKPDNTGEIVSGAFSVKLNWTYNKTSQALTLEYSGMDSGGALTYNSSKDTLYNDSMVMIKVEQ